MNSQVPPETQEHVEEPEWDRARAFLLERKTRGVELGLSRMDRFIEAIGEPWRAVPCVHVAGTNGKGSVAAMLEAALRQAGWRTGLYTSPHLIRLGERVQVDRIPMTHEELTKYVAELKPVVGSIERQSGREAGPSYFEFMTGVAFVHFVRRKCDVAVVEVGMGGRRDATNVITPELSVITSIGLDHCDALGDTLEAIAAEKAGIIKSRRPVVIGRLPAAAENVIRGIAATSEAAVTSVREVFGDAQGAYPQTALAGEFQRWNAGTALLAARTLGARWRLSDEGILHALQTVTWPGRWQRMRVGDREVIVDASHNAEGAEVLAENLRALVQQTGRRPVIITGVLGRRRAEAIIPVVCHHAREVHLVAPNQRRACTADELRSLVPTSFDGQLTTGMIAELFPRPGSCRAGLPGDSVVVTGSIYLAGEVLARLAPEFGPVESELQDF